MPEDCGRLFTEGSCGCRYELLTRTADGNEGGRHHLLTATVGNGNLYICKVQIGDKRWFKGERLAIRPVLWTGRQARMSLLFTNALGWILS